MNNFLSELSRRNAFRVSAAYVIAGWIVMQAVSVLTPALRLPDWMPSVAIVLLMIGFPIAMILTWASEVTPDGAAPEAQPTRKTDVGLIAAALVLALVGVFGPERTPAEPAMQALAKTESGRPPMQSIVVLPFNNFLGDPDLNYLVDGMTEDITTRLANSRLALRVTGRNSAFSYQGSSPDLRQVGKDLNARFVLEGSMRKMGEKVRVTAQLIVAETGNHIWSDAYDYEINEILRSTDAPVFEIYPEVEAEVLAFELKRLKSMSLEEMDIDEIALRSMATGIFPITNASIAAALEILEPVLRNDPDHATVHIFAALLYSLGVAGKYDGWETYKTKVTYHIKRSLELGPASSRTAYQVAMCYNNLVDFDTALKHASRAVRLDPTNPDAYNARAFASASLGDYEGALLDSEKLFQFISPKYSLYNSFRRQRGFILFGLGDYASAEVFLNANMLETPTDLDHVLLISILGQQRRVEDANRQIAQMQEAHPDANFEYAQEEVSKMGAQDEFSNRLIEGLRLAGLE